MSTARPLDPLLSAWQRGHAALRLSGRSMHDLVADGESIRPLHAVLRRRLHEEHGHVLLTYSMARGLEWDESLESRDRGLVEGALRRHGLAGIQPGPDEVVRVFRGLSSLLRTPADGLARAGGGPLRFAALLEFAEHLTPRDGEGGALAGSQLVAIELAHVLGQSLAMRSAGNLLMLHGRDGLLDDLVEAVLHPVRLPQPDAGEKRLFIDAVHRRLDKATFERGLDADLVARATANTPNRGLETQMRASHSSGEPVSMAELLRQKSADVEMLSQATLRTLDVGRVTNVRLAGRNARFVGELMDRLSEMLRRGDGLMPANVLLAGAQGGGKSDLALICARQAGVAAYEMVSPKHWWVGATERNARMQQRLLVEMAPCLAFCDEITESMTTRAPEHDGDSGASRAALAALLTALSDETRRGRSLLVATTNAPWRMDARMLSRFMVIPVLQPLAEDVPEILAALAERIVPGCGVTAAQPQVVEAAARMSSRGASARDMYRVLADEVATTGSLSADVVLSAARNALGGGDRVTATYYDLWAIKCATLKSFLPWGSDPATYPFPDHLLGIVDPATGDVDATTLDAAIAELRPRVNA